jgi:cephalosporin hydroxylase
MNLQGLHEAVMKEQDPHYDFRLSGVMDQKGYEFYKVNFGHTYYVYLAKMVRHLKPKKVVELGTDIGRSALFMMTQLPVNSKLYTVEVGLHDAIDLTPFKNDPRLVIVKGNDLDSAVLAKVGKDIDLLFMDTSHEYAQSVLEIQEYLPRMSPRGIIVMDDIHLNSEMDKFWSELTIPKLDCGKDLHVSGFGIAAA